MERKRNFLQSTSSRTSVGCIYVCREYIIKVTKSDRKHPVKLKEIDFSVGMNEYTI